MKLLAITYVNGVRISLSHDESDDVFAVIEQSAHIHKTTGCSTYLDGWHTWLDAVKGVVAYNMPEELLDVNGYMDECTVFPLKMGEVA